MTLVLLCCVFPAAACTRLLSAAPGDQALWQRCEGVCHNWFGEPDCSWQQPLLLDHAAPAVPGCVRLAMAASLPTLRVRPEGPTDALVYCKMDQQGRKHLQCSSGGGSKLLVASIGIPSAAAAVILLMLLGLKVAGPCSCTGVLKLFNQPLSTPTAAATAPPAAPPTATAAAPKAAAAAAAAAAAGLGPTTDVPMMVLPPFAPTCKVKILGKDTGKFGCPILSCRMDANCTIHEPSCCAYLHYEMLSFFNRFLASKCLQHEYVLAHGTALG